VVKKVQGYPGIWEARKNIKYRLTFKVEQKDDETSCILRNVDNQEECLKNLQSKGSGEGFDKDLIKVK
jgi:hypothetical protein